jgi:hypothetical protein
MMTEDHEQRQKTIEYLVDHYQQIHCIKHHECRVSSRIIAEALKVLRGEPLENELPNCDCYECGA